MADQKRPEPAKVKVVLTVPTQNAARGEKLTVDADVAERLIANNQARPA